MQQFMERFLVGRADRQTIAKHATGKDRFIGVLTILSAALLGMGVASPIMTVDGFFGLTGQYSLFTAALAYMKAGQGAYAMGIALLFGAVPVFSIATVFDLWYKYQLHEEKTERVISRAHMCGKLWFFVVLAMAALIYYAKTSSTSAEIHLALYYLLISMILQKLTLTRLGGLLSSIRYVEEDD